MILSKTSFKFTKNQIMFLNIILTILTIVLITMTVLLSLWWRKYGKKAFETLSSVKKLTSQIPNQTPQGQNMGDLMDRLKKINEMFGSFKR